MQKINPEILRGQTQGKASEARVSIAPRNQNMSFLSVIKSGFLSALEKVTMKVEVTNAKEYHIILQKITQLLQQIQSQAKSLQIGKADLTTQQVDSLSVNNLEELKIENATKIGFAMEQLTPMITALQAGNKLDQQSTAILKNIYTVLSHVGEGIDALSEKEIEFPVDILEKKLEEVKEAIGNIRFDVPKTEPIKFPSFPKNIGITEGKAMLSLLQEVSEKLDKLPTKYPEMRFPQAISIDNFPPQKYPLPVTNININPLKGVLLSTAVTVGATVTALPPTPLNSRRSLVAYNNGSTPVYIGGVGVTSLNGIIVPAFTYSPAFDAATNMIVYAVSAAGTTNEVRVLELSNETITTHTNL